MKKMLLFSSLLLLSLSFNGCLKQKNITTSQPRSDLPVSTQTLPSITPPTSTLEDSYQLQTIQGSILKIQERSNGFIFPQFQGKIILLQIFGQNCQYCLEEMPFIKKMQRKYSQNLNLIALHADTAMTPPEAQEVLRKFQINYPVIDRDEAKSLLFSIKDTYNWAGNLPFMLLIKDGVTEYIFSGEMNHQEFEESLRSIL